MSDRGVWESRAQFLRSRREFGRQLIIQNSRESFLPKSIVIQPAVNSAMVHRTVIILASPRYLEYALPALCASLYRTDSEMLLRSDITCIAKHRFVTSVVRYRVIALYQR